CLADGEKHRQNLRGGRYRSWFQIVLRQGEPDLGAFLSWTRRARRLRNSRGDRTRIENSGNDRCSFAGRSQPRRRPDRTLADPSVSLSPDRSLEIGGADRTRGQRKERSIPRAV